MKAKEQAKASTSEEASAKQVHVVVLVSKPAQSLGSWGVKAEGTLVFVVPIT